MLSHPRIDGGIPLDRAVESEYFRRFHGSQFIIQKAWIRPWINLRSGARLPISIFGYASSSFRTIV
jgi:hypothetical protein